MKFGAFLAWMALVASSVFFLSNSHISTTPSTPVEQADGGGPVPPAPPWHHGIVGNLAS
jgi:hypothetical protein